MVLIIFSVAFVFVQHLAAKADTIVVTASVPAPLPTIPPVITSPFNNAQFITPSVIVRGTCQIITPANIIALYRGDTFLGSASCSSNGTFAITINMIEGPNTITPKSFNVMGAAGPVGNSITIFYNPLAPSTGFSLTTDIPFITYRLDKPFEWSVYINGGRAPYSLFISWGDGTNQTVSIKSAGKVELSHSYSQINRYIVRATAIDKTGAERSLEELALTLTSPRSPEVLGATAEAPWSKNVPNVYIAFMAILIALVAFRITPWLVSKGWVEVFDTKYGNHTMVIMLVIPFGIVLLMLAIFLYNWLSLYL